MKLYGHFNGENQRIDSKYHPHPKGDSLTIELKKENGCVCGAPFCEAFDIAAEGGSLGWFSSAESELFGMLAACRNPM